MWCDGGWGNRRERGGGVGDPLRGLLRFCQQLFTMRCSQTIGCGSSNDEISFPLFISHFWKWYFESMWVLPISVIVPLCEPDTVQYMCLIITKGCGTVWRRFKAWRHPYTLFVCRFHSKVFTKYFMFSIMALIWLLGVISFFKIPVGYPKKRY